MEERIEALEGNQENFVAGLVQRTQEGSLVAAGELLIRFRPLILAAARRYRISGVVDAEDLQQEAAIALLEATFAFNPAVGVSYAYFTKQRVYARMWTLVRREQTWTARSQQTLEFQDEPVQQIVDLLADPAAERLLVSALDRLDLAVPVERLSEREKLAIGAILRDVPMQELARQQGVSMETAKTWRKRALAKLRREMTSYE